MNTLKALGMIPVFRKVATKMMKVMTYFLEHQHGVYAHFPLLSGYFNKKASEACPALEAQVLRRLCGRAAGKGMIAGLVGWGRSLGHF